MDPPVEPPEEGVAIEPVAAGEADPEGVEACSVANRSGVGEEAIGRLHPIKSNRRRTVRKGLRLFINPFDRLEIELFAR